MSRGPRRKYGTIRGERKGESRAAPRPLRPDGRGSPRECGPESPPRLQIKAQGAEFGFDPCFKGNYKFADINKVFPEYINESLKEAIDYFNTKIDGFNRDDAVLAAIESRTSSPIRIERDELFNSNIKGIYPIGEGAGYAGGITTSAIDGLKVVEIIASIYKN